MGVDDKCDSSAVAIDEIDVVAIGEETKGAALALQQVFCLFL